MFPGYKVVDVLHRSTKAVVYRGKRAVDGHGVILKLLAEECPTPERVAAFRQEFEINRRLARNPGVCAFERIGDRWLMVLEDAGGATLASMKIAGKLSILEFLRLSIRIVEELGELHKNLVIHRDLSPGNIVVDARSGAVRLIDFGASTFLQRQNATFSSPSGLKGTLTYMAPEQTGRMNRAVDYRGDYYSIGVILYELIVGKPPFITDDPLELVHSHIAKHPPPPNISHPATPDAVSRIILKLLAKNAEDRYQSASGLLYDLRVCLEQAERAVTIQLPRLGQRDINEHFRVPDALYGRAAETQSLLAAFERISYGTCEIALVTGYAGSGKTVLVRELYRPITRKRGYFISGKFDQLQQTIPYSAMVQAFRSLMRQLLAEPPEQVAAWRRLILAAVGHNGQVLIRVIPELQLILGPQRDVAELRPEDAYNRFNLLLQGLVRVFTSPEHPLVIFLDDLQWADKSSLDLLEALGSSDLFEGLLIIVACRTHEVDPAHPVQAAMDRIRRNGAAFTDVDLQPLRREDVVAMVAHAVHRPPEEVTALADLVGDKTGGNPLFIGEFLRQIHYDGLIELDHARGSWRWNLEQIRQRNITENVVDLMAHKARELDIPTQDVLRLAAVLGSRFDLRSLVMISNQAPLVVTRALWEALQTGFIAPIGEVIALLNLEVDVASVPAFEMRFTHDRIRQAFYAMTPEAERPTVHAVVGQHLLTRTTPDDLPSRIFDIIVHLNQGRAALTTWEQREHLAGLNRLAAARARDASAFSAAHTYFQLSADLLADEGWSRNYPLTFAVNLGAAESACMIRETEDMHRAAATTLAHARGVLDRVKIQQVLILDRTMQFEPRMAVRLAIAALRELGVHMSPSPVKLDVATRIVRTKIALMGTRTDALSALPVARDPLATARAEVMASVISAAYRGVPNVFICIVLEVVKMSVLHGNTPASGFAYTCYALILSGALGDIEGGTRLIPVTEAMLDMPMTRPFKAKTLFALGAFVLPWSAPLRVCAARLYEGYMSGLEVGDLEFAAHCGYLRSYFRLRSCENLQELVVDLEQMVTGLRPLGQPRETELCAMYLQTARNLRGPATGATALASADFDITANLAESYRLGDTRAIVEANLQKLVLEFLFGDLEAARSTADRIPPHLADLPGFPPACESHCFDALVLLDVLAGLEPRARRAAMRRIHHDAARLRLWARAAPTNYFHLHLLVEAELKRLAGQEGEARILYDRAIVAATERQLVRDEAIICERAAGLYRAHHTELSLHYLRRAHRAYAAWGARAKVESLESAYPQLIASREPGHVARAAMAHGPQEFTSSLDLSSVLRASQIISSEIAQEKLLAAMIKVVMESAGADRGALLQQHEGRWQCAVSGRTIADGIQIDRNLPVSEKRFPLSIVYYTARTRETIVRERRGPSGSFSGDPYVAGSQVRSLLCMPLVNQSRLVGVLYLENSVSDAAFSEARLSFLRMLAAQMATSIENSDLFSNLERMVEQRTAELREANSSLVASNQELDAFARTVAHDLKNPLGTIAGYTRYLLEDLAEIDQNELIEVLGRIEHTSEHTVRIVNELLLLASVRKGDIKMVPVDMGSIVQGALDRLDGMIVDRHAEIEGPVRWPAVVGHALWIEELWANYISNAIKYGGGPPRVEVGADVLDEHHVRFWVRDNGPGISEDGQRKIFAEFTRLEGAGGEGHGLGLSIVKRIAERLDGTVGMTSRLGEGSVFFFTLPRAPEPAS